MQTYSLKDICEYELIRMPACMVRVLYVTCVMNVAAGSWICLAQEPECVRWYRRCHVLHAVHSFFSASSLTHDTEGQDCGVAKRSRCDEADDEVARLLRDPRLTYCEGRLLASVMMGQIVTMLSGCCEQRFCPGGIPYGTQALSGSPAPICRFTEFLPYPASNSDSVTLADRSDELVP